MDRFRLGTCNGSDVNEQVQAWDMYWFWCKWTGSDLGHVMVLTSEPLHVPSLNLSIYIRTITCPKPEPVHLHQNHYMSQVWTCPFTSERLHVPSLNLSIYIRIITCPKSEPVHLHQNHYMSQAWTCPFTSEPLHVPSLNLSIYIRTITCPKSEPVHLH
jgi:hypothetical protein